MPGNVTQGIAVGTLIDGLSVELVRGSASTQITSVVEDSRCAAPGSLFVARAGTKADGRDYAAEASARGAAAVLADRATPEGDLPAGVVLLTAEAPGKVLGALAERFFGSPARALRLAGVTGTNGKTTVCHLLHHVLCRAGLRAGLISTVRIDHGATQRPARMTTPPALEISRSLAAMAAGRCRAAVLEVSSHGLDQGRTAGLAFDAAVFTNLTGDHPDYHRTREAYAAAKAILFRSLAPSATAVVNADDPAWETMVDGCAARVLRCSLLDPAADCRAQIIDQSFDPQTPASCGLDSSQTPASCGRWGAARAVMAGPWGAFELRLPLIGRHNVTNALLAAAGAWALGVREAAIATALSTCTAPPGRLEPVPVPDNRFTVLVDYAHTDDALRNVLSSLRPLVPEGARLRVVFGCGGDRDRTKRPRMARAAAELADELIITSDNPRTERPEAILDEVLAGVPAERRDDTLAVISRRQAIETAIERSEPGDVVLIAGKGHETYQVIGTEKHAFDDRAVAREALAGLVSVTT